MENNKENTAGGGAESAPRDLKFKIAVSGAADTTHCAPDALEKAEELGRLIAKRNMVLVTGATTGAPFWAARGAKKEGGFVIGISPAISEEYHVSTYHLPLEYHDVIIFTGYGYAGRNLIVMRSGDATITVCGRMGTLNEFTDAFEDGKVQGVLLGCGGTTDLIPQIMEKAHRGPGKVVFDTDPGALVEKVIEAMKKETSVHHNLRYDI